jgi:hypothetical protein
MNLSWPYIPSTEEWGFGKYLNWPSKTPNTTNAAILYGLMWGDTHANKKGSKELTYETLKTITFYGNEKPEATK